MSAGLSVQQLFDDLLVLLDGQPSVDAVACSADPVLQASEAGQGADARGLPLWAQWDARNFRNTVVTTSDQYVILVEVTSGQQNRTPQW